MADPLRKTQRDNHTDPQFRPIVRAEPRQLENTRDGYKLLCVGLTNILSQLNQSTPC